MDTKYRKQIIASLFFARKKVLHFLRDFLMGMFLGQAIIKRNDEAYDWLLNYISKQNNLFRPSSRLEVQSITQTKRAQKSLFTLKSDGNFRYVPARNEMVCFRFEGVFFWASRKELDNKNVPFDPYGRRGFEVDKEIKLYYLALTSTPLKRLLVKAKSLYKRETRPALTIKHLDRHSSGWKDLTEIDKRSMESIHLPAGVKEQVLRDAKEFISKDNYEFFKERNIPYRRGYLFYGEPGSGKSSLCHALASAIDRSIYVMNLAENSLSDHRFNSLMSSIPGGCIVLMEDIDAAFVKRTSPRPPTRFRDDECGDCGTGISFSTLLNAIDGISAAEGRLLCLTTNHIEKLDHALIRPGRIDLRIKFSHATQEQAKELFLHWYLPRKSKVAKPTTTETKDAQQAKITKVDIVAATGNSDSGIDEKIEGDKSAPDEDASPLPSVENESDKIRQLAEEFSQKITPDTVSVAAIQGYLLMCGKDYNKVVKGAEKWLAEQILEQQKKITPDVPPARTEATSSKQTQRARRSGPIEILDQRIEGLNTSDSE
ncbi:P-loop containing nucleoside triphosphate hydrolase protein [Meira miltonrushii]|uniref:P-loop containing nucleoside triphosphate hydrolase protein n=1 Tax=Meira miltonrushii TaxID=1280837 RepID=A0A316VIE7_9BASI|nr:P-loop containing nucleoside triphosphate hydrolase protein [Meira miltonrushii]PWN35781.1 P-loop containing nucleoside triphosphate hydrolase protein [Meira miltonrushii]